MGSCVAFNCTNRCSKKIPGLTFHCFPKDETRRKLWVIAVRRKNWEPSSCSKLCSKHFPEEMIDRTSLSCVRLRDNAVPSIFDFSSHLQKKKMKRNGRVAKKSCSNSNKQKDSSLSLQPFVQSNDEAVQLSLKREILDDLSVPCDSIVTETSVNAIVAKTSCSDGNVGTDSSSLLQSSVQSNEEAVEPSVKIEVPDDSSPVCVSFGTETSVNAIVAKTSCSDGNVGTDSSSLLQSSVQSNKEAVEPSVKIEVPDDSSPVYVSFVTETPINAIVAKANCSDRNEGMDSSLSLQPSVQLNEDDADPSLKRRKPNNSSLVYDLAETETPVILKAQSASVQVLPAFNIESGNLVVTSLNQVHTEKANQPMKGMELNKEDAKPSLKNSTPVRDSFDTEAPITAIVAETSCFDRNEGTDPSLSLQPSVESIEEVAGPPLKRKKLSNSSPMCDSTETETPVILKAWSASAQEPPAFDVTLGNFVVASLNQMPTEKANAAMKEIFDVLLKYGRETNHLR